MVIVCLPDMLIYLDLFFFDLLSHIFNILRFFDFFLFLFVCFKLQVNDGRLRTAGEASQRSTKEDWAEWMRHFSIELLRESPSPALRTCARLAQLQVLLWCLIV